MKYVAIITVCVCWGGGGGGGACACVCVCARAFVRACLIYYYYFNSMFNYYVYLHFREGVVWVVRGYQYECLLVVLTCESLHVCTVRIRRCEPTRFFMRHI